MHRPQIIKFSHRFTIHKMSREVQRAAVMYAGTLQEYIRKFIPGRGYIREASKAYAIANPDRSKLTFHINQLDTFLSFISHQGINIDTIDIDEMEMYEPAPANFKIVSHMKPRDEQPEFIDYLADTSGNNKILSLQTGKGKGYCTCAALERIGNRTLIIVAAKYIKKWIKELNELFIKPNMVVMRGSKDLRKVHLLGATNSLDADIILVSITTMNNYFKEYAKTGPNNFEYDVLPEDMCHQLGIGTVVFDEVHENLHQNYKCYLYFHVPRIIALSATITSDDKFINYIFSVLWPAEIRPRELAYTVYAKANNVIYRLNHPRGVKYKRRKQYSHTRYEDYIMESPKRLKNYIDMILTVAEYEYINDRKPNTVMLIYAARVNLCNHIRDAIKARYPNLSVTTKTSDDDFKVIYEHDIIVSTTGSTGTAVDIPGLTNVLQTVAISARQQNLQNLGRLRELKGEFEGIVPLFTYLTCSDIDKHLEYAKKKREDIFKGRLLEHVDKHTTFMV